MSQRRESEYKPLLLTTTLRNPERIKTFLAIIAKYNGQLLTNDVIDKIVFDLVSAKEYIPVYVNRCLDLKSQLQSEEPFSVADTKRIIKIVLKNIKKLGLTGDGLQDLIHGINF